jgi:cold shock CspA family protein/ribosome-associated translation inhibitor RaiA
MPIPLHIAYEGGLTATPALQERIEHEAAKLERFADRIVACHVVLVGRSGRRRHGDLFKVRIRLTAPGGVDVVADRNPDMDHAHEDPYVAIRDAFSAARRQLQDRERRQGGEVKHHEAPPHGRVSRVLRDEGYGFIETSEGQTLYFHRNAVVGDDFDKLQEGAEVRYVEAQGDKGPQASTVHLVGKSHIVDLP